MTGVQTVLFRSKLKSFEEICDRAIACLLSIQLAEDIHNEQGYEESKELFLSLLEKYEVSDCLLEKEKRLFDGIYIEQDVIDVYYGTPRISPGSGMISCSGVMTPRDSGL